ncbi:hypothetical protein H0H92_003009 [Tricholoma furcatifolium]|nr:hypothetical protein H0H92_003009 [Tricholoma furcatifolium]
MHLFDGVRYSLSSSLSEERLNELSHVLDSNGAIQAESIDDVTLTHFITNSNTFERWQDIATREDEGKISVVTLEATDLEVLSAGITALGGQWRTGLTRDVTHLFVTTTTSQKYSTALHFREDTHVKILLPHWFDDAVRLGTGVLDTTPYEWPDPPLLRPYAGQEGESAKADAMKRSALRKLDADKKTMYRTTDLLLPGAPLPTEEETSQSSSESPRRKGKNVWDGRRVLLGRSLELSGSRRDAVEAEIVRAGGKVVSYDGSKGEEAAAVDRSDVLVTRFRSGRAYVQAVRQAKTIGTLPWVFHVHSTGTLSPPMDQLLWYPIPKRPIEGFSGHEITVTNYTGEAREYIKKLIGAMGAVFTPSMSGKNTVLIAAYVSGTKTTKAASWSIPIVNHLWLEDCFVKWRNLTVALEKYIVFPPGVDFSTQLGNRGVGRDAEDLGEDELEVLEQEDDEEEDIPVEPESSIPAANGSATPSRTPATARDEKEVEEVERTVLDGDVHMENDVAEIQSGGEDLEGEDQDERMVLEEEEQLVVASIPTPTPKSTKTITERLQEKDKGESAAKTRIKPRPKGKPKAPPRDSSATPEVHAKKRKINQEEETPLKKRSRIDTGSGSDRDIVETAEKKTYGKKTNSKLVRRVGERSDSWIMDAVVITPLRLKRRVQEEGQEEQAEKPPAMPKRGILKKTPSKIVFSDEEEVVTVSEKKGKKRSQAEEDERVPTKGMGRKLATVGSSSTSKRGKERQPSLESEDSDIIIVSTPKSKSKPNASEAERVKPKPAGKGRKAVERLESEEEEEPSPPPKKTPTKPRTSSSKSKKAFTPPTSDGEDELSQLPEPSSSKKTSAKPRASTAKSKTALPPASEEPSSLKKPAAKPRASTSRSKKAPTPPASDEDEEDHSPVKPTTTRPTPKAKKALASRIFDDDDLSPPPTPAKKATAKETRAAPQASKGKGRAPPSDDGEDEDKESEPEPEARRSRTKSSAKLNERPQPVPGPSTTPKRTVSVLLPGLTLAAKSPAARTPTTNNLSRTDSIRVAAGERAVTNRKATTSESTSKPKPKVKPSLESVSPPPAAEDAEESIIVGGRARRGAAARASQKLHEEIMPDVVNFQQEMRNVGKGRRSVGGLPLPKRHSLGPPSDNEETRDTKRRRLSGPINAKKNGKAAVSEDEEEEEVEEVVAQPAKGKNKGKRSEGGEDSEIMKAGKPKRTKADDLEGSSESKSGTTRLMTTQVTLTDDVLKALTKLGVKITIKPSECTHLLAPHLVRTEKFLCALANAPFILTSKWATDSAAAKKLLDERNYLLRDKVNEKKFDFVLADALERAKELRGTLFAKMTFYITPKVQVDIKLLKNVVTACGGQVNTQPPTLRIMNANPDRYIVSCPEDVSIWRPIASTHPIYTHELILTSALKQEIDWENEKYRVPGSQ